MIPIFSPHINSKAKKNVNFAIKSNWISSQGKYVSELEDKIKKYHKMKFCLVTSSCTSALHLSLLSFGLKKGDEIICPSLSFIAPANMILLSNFKIVFVDIDINTLNIDINRIEKKITKKTKAILFVNQFGHPADIDKLKIFKKKYNLKLIEDNAESLGGKYKNKLNGTHGDISTMSFFANKIVTTGEGGAILTNNYKLYRSCREMRDHGMSIHRKYYHTKLGFNYRMTNLQAAIGVSQFDDIKKIIELRNKQQNYYYKLLKNEKHFSKRKFKNWCTPVHWLMTITLKKSYLRNKLIKFMKKKGIELRPMINPIQDAPQFKIYRDPKEVKVAKYVSKNSVHLPSSPNLKKKQIIHICKILNDFFEYL